MSKSPHRRPEAPRARKRAGRRDLRKHWNNTGAWTVGQNYDLELFPLLTDFKVELVEIAGGLDARFSSPSFGPLVAFAWTSGPRPTQPRIPCGTRQAPFSDLDQGYHVEIFEADGFVHVLCGDGDGLNFDRYFKLAHELYFERWRQALELDP